MADASYGVASVEVPGLGLCDAAVDFDDLAFLALIDCMQQSDAALRGKLAEIRALNQRKKELTDRLEQLTRAYEQAEDADGDDLIQVPGEGEPFDPEVLAELNNDTLNSVLKLPSSRLVARDLINQLEEQQQHDRQLAEAAGCLTKDEIKTEIDHIRNELEELNTSSSVLLIDLNRLLNQRNEAVQLTSNIVRKSHETALAIIKNV